MNTKKRWLHESSLPGPRKFRPGKKAQPLAQSLGGGEAPAAAAIQEVAAIKEVLSIDFEALAQAQEEDDEIQQLAQRNYPITFTIKDKDIACCVILKPQFGVT